MGHRSCSLRGTACRGTDCRGVARSLSVAGPGTFRRGRAQSARRRRLPARPRPEGRSAEARRRARPTRRWGQKIQTIRRAGKEGSAGGQVAGLLRHRSSRPHDGSIGGLRTGDQLVLGVEDGLAVGPVADHPLGHQTGAGLDPGDPSPPLEDEEQAARVVGQHALEVGRDPARGWTRTDLTRPATRTRWRHWASPIGTAPCPRSPNAARSKSDWAPGAHRGPRRARPGGRVGRLAHLGAAPREPAAGELVGDDRRVDVGHLPDRRGDLVGGRVVEDPVPSRGEPPPRQEDGELGLAVGDRLGGELERRPGSADGPRTPRCRGAVGEAEPAPLGLELGGHPRLSRLKWTARSSSGWRVLAYWSARAVAMSSRSTQHDHHMAPEHRCFRRLGRPLLELVLPRPCTGGGEPEQPEHAEGKDRRG